jgi:hypothetical protein
MTAVGEAVGRLFGFFRTPEPIDTLPALDEFLDRQAAFNAQQCIVEYARARAGILSAKLFKEKAFIAAVNHGRWHGYAVTLGHVCEMADAALSREARARRPAVIAGLVRSANRIIDRYPTPAGEPATFWPDARLGVAQRLAQAAMRAPRPVKDIPLDTVQQIFDVLPIHQSLTGHDYELVQNNLRSNLVRAHETLIARADLSKLVALMAGVD